MVQLGLWSETQNYIVFMKENLEFCYFLDGLN